MADQFILARRNASAVNGGAERGTTAPCYRGQIGSRHPAGSLAFAVAGESNQAPKVLRSRLLGSNCPQKRVLSNFDFLRLLRCANERAVAALRGQGIVIGDESLAHLSPIGWEHVNLTGDYTYLEFSGGALRTV